MGEAGSTGGDSGDLAGRVAALEHNLLLANDAALGLAGILSCVVVEAGMIGRAGLADIVEQRAGPVAAGDHNSLLRAFARALRMNLPGGRFEVVGGSDTAAAR